MKKLNGIKLLIHPGFTAYPLVDELKNLDDHEEDLEIEEQIGRALFSDYLAWAKDMQEDDVMVLYQSLADPIYEMNLSQPDFTFARDYRSFLEELEKVLGDRLIVVRSSMLFPVARSGKEIAQRLSNPATASGMDLNVDEVLAQIEQRGFKFDRTVPVVAAGEYANACLVSYANQFHHNLDLDQPIILDPRLTEWVYEQAYTDAPEEISGSVHLAFPLVSVTRITEI